MSEFVEHPPVEGPGLDLLRRDGPLERHRWPVLRDGQCCDSVSRPRPRLVESDANVGVVVARTIAGTCPVAEIEIDGTIERPLSSDCGNRRAQRHGAVE